MSGKIAAFKGKFFKLKDVLGRQCFDPRVTYALRSLGLELNDSLVWRKGSDPPHLVRLSKAVDPEDYDECGQENRRTLITELIKYGQQCQSCVANV